MITNVDISYLVFDAFTSVLGGFTEVQGLLKSQYATVPLLDISTGKIIDEAYPKTAPDSILVQGILESGAVASIASRTVKSAADDTNIRWIITGTEGEIEYTIPEASANGGTPPSSFRLKVGKEETASVEVVPSDSPANKVAAPATNTARLYEDFAKGSGDLVTFESALKTHLLLERIAKSSGVEL
jgi:predicted dehydrogenase